MKGNRCALIRPSGQAKPTEKPYKLTDGKGLYALGTPAGKYWRMDYRFNDKRLTLALGIYPDVSFARAREKPAKARTLLADGSDPGPNSFEFAAREWRAMKLAKKWTQSTRHDRDPAGSLRLLRVRAPAHCQHEGAANTGVTAKRGSSRE